MCKRFIVAGWTMIYAVAPNASIDASVQFRAHVGAIFGCKDNFGSMVRGKIKRLERWSPYRLSQVRPVAPFRTMWRCSLLHRRDRCIQRKSIALDGAPWIDCTCPSRSWKSRRNCYRPNFRWPDMQSPTIPRRWWIWIEPLCCMERSTMFSRSDLR